MKTPGSGALRCAVLFALVLSILSALGGSIFAQGSLTPSGAPTPTMKTLAQIEARKPIDATNTPGDSANQFIITQPGSYYLIANVTVPSGKNGIQVQVSDVTIDLNGFLLAGVSPSRGIDARFVPRVTVRNGRLSGWGIGIDTATAASSTDYSFSQLVISGDGIQAGASARISECTVINSPLVAISAIDGALIDRCIVRNASGYGIQIFGNAGARISNCTISAIASPTSNRAGIKVADHCIINDCTITGFSGAGIDAGMNVVIDSCTTTNNGVGSANSGIVVGPYSTLARCVSSQNTSAGFLAGEHANITRCAAHDNNGGFGISCGAQSHVRDCVVSGNGIDGMLVGDITQVTNCVAANNFDDGIEAMGGCLIEHCSAFANVGNGIRAATNCVIRENLCHTNGVGAGSGAGVFVTSAGNRIEGNAVNFNDRGIDVDAGFNVIIRNTARGNSGTGTPSASYDIAANNDVGPIGSAAAATSAWANIAF